MWTRSSRLDDKHASSSADVGQDMWAKSQGCPETHVDSAEQNPPIFAPFHFLFSIIRPSLFP